MNGKHKMVVKPSNEVTSLVATLLEQLDGDDKARDAVLLQLHAVFGSMLVSALQLVDRREVVKVDLPGNRHLHQVTSSTGSSYTLYVDLPERPLLPDLPRRETSPPLTPPDIDGDSPMGDPEPGEKASAQKTDGGHRAPEETKSEHEKLLSERKRPRRAFVKALGNHLQSLYCPCAGFGYNTLTGDRHFLCKHLLAVVVAHCMGRMVRTEVGLRDVVLLLGLGTRDVSREEGTEGMPKREQRDIMT